MALTIFSAFTVNIAGVAVNGCTRSCIAVTAPAKMLQSRHFEQHPLPHHHNPPGRSYTTLPLTVILWCPGLCTSMPANGHAARSLPCRQSAQMPSCSWVSRGMQPARHRELRPKNYPNSETFHEPSSRLCRLGSAARWWPGRPVRQSSTSPALVAQLAA